MGETSRWDTNLFYYVIYRCCLKIQIVETLKGAVRLNQNSNYGLQ